MLAKFHSIKLICSSFALLLLVMTMLIQYRIVHKTANAFVTTPPPAPLSSILTKLIFCSLGIWHLLWEMAVDDYHSITHLTWLLIYEMKMKHTRATENIVFCDLRQKSRKREKREIWTKNQNPKLKADDSRIVEMNERNNQIQTDFNKTIKKVFIFGLLIFFDCWNKLQFGPLISVDCWSFI